jgi:hypothetical protein
MLTGIFLRDFPIKFVYEFPLSLRHAIALTRLFLLLIPVLGSQEHEQRESIADENSNLSGHFKCWLIWTLEYKRSTDRIVTRQLVGVEVEEVVGWAFNGVTEPS